MQRLTGGPRAQFTEQQILRLLHTPAPNVSAGIEVLSLDLEVLDDLSGSLIGGSVARNMNAAVHGTCRVSLALERDLAWGNRLVRPYVLLSDRYITARFDAGVFALLTPATSATSTVRDADGQDRVYLLNRPVARDYVVLAGVTYRRALLDVFEAAGLGGVQIEGSAADETVPKERPYPLVSETTDPDQTSTPVTWLRIVNDLLRALNFGGVWCDEGGRFRCEAYRSPADRAPEFTFDADDSRRVSLVGLERDLERDLYATPNLWTFRWTNAPEGTPLADLTWSYGLPDAHPLSAVSRGLEWPVVIDYEAASRATFLDLGRRRVDADLRTTTRLTVNSGPFPLAGHSDVFTYRDARLGGTRKVVTDAWRYDLLGRSVRWDWEEVT